MDELYLSQLCSEVIYVLDKQMKLVWKEPVTHKIILVLKY